MNPIIGPLVIITAASLIWRIFGGSYNGEIPFIPGNNKEAKK